MVVKYFFYYHRRFLPIDHKYRNDFFVSKVEMDVARQYRQVKNRMI